MSNTGPDTSVETLTEDDKALLDELERAGFQLVALDDPPLRNSHELTPEDVLDFKRIVWAK